MYWHYIGLCIDIILDYVLVFYVELCIGMLDYLLVYFVCSLLCSFRKIIYFSKYFIERQHSEFITIEYCQIDFIMVVIISILHQLIIIDSLCFFIEAHEEGLIFICYSSKMIALMNESPFTACQNSVKFESYSFVKFTILSPNFCPKYRDLCQTLDISPTVPLDVWIFLNELPF